MTNEEAIKILKQYLDMDAEVKSEYLEAQRMAIKALGQQPCEDCISREELINELKLGYFNKDLQEVKNDPCVIDAMIDWAIRTAKRLPSVTPSILDVENDFNLGYNCGYADAMFDMAEGSENE